MDVTYRVLTNTEPAAEFYLLSFIGKKDKAPHPDAV